MIDKDDEARCPRIDPATGQRCPGSGTIGKDLQNKVWVWTCMVCGDRWRGSRIGKTPKRRDPGRRGRTGRRV